MFEKEVRELFDLSLRVINETDFYVSFRIASHVHFCDINIMNSKWEADKTSDANYSIYLNSEILKNESAEQCKLAKAHLLELLINGRCPLDVKSNGTETPADNGADNDSERASCGAEQTESVHP